MAPKRIRTRDYTPQARQRLGDAVAKAREAAGWRYRTSFAKECGINVRSIEMLEAGGLGVGQTILFAVGRALPGWTEDTPRAILEGGEVPSADSAPQSPQSPPPPPPETDDFQQWVERRELRDEVEREMFLLVELDEEVRWAAIIRRRLREGINYQQSTMRHAGDH